LEAAFETRLSELLPSEGAEVAKVAPSESVNAGGHKISKIDERRIDQVSIDKSVLTVAAPRRYRNLAARRRGELRVRHRFGGEATPLQYLLDLTKYFAGISANAALTSEAASALQSLLSCAGRV